MNGTLSAVSGEQVCFSLLFTTTFKSIGEMACSQLQPGKNMKSARCHLSAHCSFAAFTMVIDHA
jgi:hypothetical protein